MNTTIHCKAELYEVNGRAVLHLPMEASKQLPTRGQTMVIGTFNDQAIHVPVEPDGRGSHYFQVSNDLQASADVSAGDTVSLEITPTKDWIEPGVPTDLMSAITADPEVNALWQQITPMARWEWVRWTRSTSNNETRLRRIEVACSKMRAGKRRPCCWNRNLSTELEVSKSGALLLPSKS